MQGSRPGFTLIELLVVIAIIGVLIGLLLPAVMRVRETAARAKCQSNLRQVGLALYQYENVNGHFSPCKLTQPTRHGWGLFIFPYIEQKALFDQYHWDKNWSATANGPVRKTHLRLLQCPSAQPDRFVLTAAGNPQAAAADYAPVDGIQPLLRNRLGYPSSADLSGVLRADIYTRATDIIDGASNCIMIAEDAGRPDVYRAGKLDPSFKSSGACWADDEAEFDIDGYSFDGQTVNGDCAVNCYSSKLLESLPNLDATLIDLSQPMLDRAKERIGRATAGNITTIQADIREVKLPDEEFDIVLAAAVLHHLRTDQEWRDVFTALHRALRPSGSVWVFDLVESSIPAVVRLMRQRYGEYLTRLKDEAYRDHVFAYVEKEDTPRPLLFQLDLLRQVGFSQVEVLHKNVCFAAFGAVKG